MTVATHDTSLPEPLKGGLVTLKAFQTHHIYAPEYLSWLRDPEVVRTLNLPAYLETLLELNELEEYCHRLIASDRDVFVALHSAKNDEFIGTCKIAHIDWYAATADIGIMIGNKSYWGKGVASEAIHMLCSFAFEKMNFRKLTAGAMGTNKAMIKVFQKYGFITEGIRRQQDRLGTIYVDHILLGCFKDEFELRLSAQRGK